MISICDSPSIVGHDRLANPSWKLVEVAKEIAVRTQEYFVPSSAIAQSAFNVDVTINTSSDVSCPDK